MDFVWVGSQGIVNLGKLLSGVGAVAGGGLDLVETKVIANRAYKWFMQGDFSATANETDDEVVIDIEENEIMDESD